jgi:hypothetical protein
MVNLWLIMVNNWNNKWNWLVVTGTMEFYDFPYIGNGITIPTDELHHFSEG